MSHLDYSDTGDAMPPPLPPRRTLLARLGVRSVPRAELVQRYTQPASAFVDIMGARVHYTDAGSGPVLVLVHGFAASLHTWDAVAGILRRQYRVICVDLPPFGVSGPLRKPDGSIVTMEIDTYRQLFDAFIDALGIGRAALIGNSLGGLVAWDYAVRHPGRVSKLVLIDAAGFPMKLPIYIALFKHALVRWSSPWLLPEPIIRSAVRDVYGDPGKISATTMRRYIDFFHADGVRAAIGKMVPMLDLEALDRSGLSDLRVPTLILWGDRDNWIPPAHADHFERAISGARKIMYAGLGHIPMEEDPLRVSADIQRFLTV